MTSSPITLSLPQERKLQLHDWKWRLNNLYYIVSDLNGEPEKILFKMTPVQELLFDTMHDKNVILKSRQHGITTFMVIFMLDRIIFQPDLHCGFVAQDRDSAEDIFYKKVLYAYDNLPAGIKNVKRTEKKSGKMLVIKHSGGSTSSIRVGTSLRSGTYAYIHISEYGKICAQDPKKAAEIISGSLNAGYSCVVSIESTAEGNYGNFFDICQKAEFHTGPLTRMDYKFFFFGWTKHQSSVLECPDFDYGPHLDEYFKDKNLTRQQMNWYAKKLDEQGDLMKQEFPTTPAEAFEQSMEGAFFSYEMRKTYEDGRICDTAYNPAYSVHTAWDIGIDDYTVVWFFQKIGAHFRFIDYYEQSDRAGLPGIAAELSRKPYHYGTHIAPHDMGVTEFGTGMSRVELARANHGLYVKMAPKLSISDGISAMRDIFKHCIFDKVKCEAGLKHLLNYRKKWDAKRRVFLAAPEHDDTSHGADAFRYFSVASQIVEERNHANEKILETTKW